MTMINGKDSSGNKAWIMVDKKDNMIHILSSEEGSAVMLNTRRAKELIATLQGYIRQ